MHIDILAGGSEISLSGRVQLLVFAMFWTLISSLIAWIAGFYQLPTSNDKQKVSGWNVFGAFSVFLITAILVAPIISLVWIYLQKGTLNEVKESEPLISGWVNLFSIFLSAIAVLGYCALIRPEVRHAVFGPKAFSGVTNAIKDLATGVISWLICFPIMIIGSSILGIIVLWFEIPVSHNEQVAVRFFKTTLGHPLLYKFTAVALIAVVPLLEETLFRGFLQNWLKPKWGCVKAILVTSVIFALFHFSTSQGLDNLELLVSLFILSCFLGFIYERQQSLLAPIGLHAVFNALSISMILFEEV